MTEGRGRVTSPDKPTVAVDRRQVEEARRDAEDALIRYAAALSWWNAPDEAHTRLQLRGLIEAAATLGIKEPPC